MRTLILPLLIAASFGAGHVAGPEPFAPGVVSTGHEFTVTFTPDGHEVYFTRGTATPRSTHVMHSVLVNGTWQPATPVEFSGGWADLDPSLSPDGKRLYFVSTRPRPSGTATTAKPDMDIWYSDRVGDRWAEPHWVEELSSDAQDGSPTIDRNGTICFFSARGMDPSSNGIYCATRDGARWTVPVRLNANINAGPSDTSPFLSPDGNTLLFYSTRPGGAGKADLYIAHKANGDWQSAVSLGPVVNGPEFDYNPSVSPDGASFYFGRDRQILVVPMSELDPRVITPAMFR